MIPDCEKCPYQKMCAKGFVIDCDTGEILDPPGEDIGSATYKAVQEQNDSYLFKTVFESIGEKQEKLTNETDELLEEEDDYVQHNYYGC